MRVLKNYKLLKQNGFEEYPAVEIRYEDNDVFEELPICAIPFGTEFKDPILISITQKGIANIAERSILVKHLKDNTQKIFFKLDKHSNPKLVNEETTMFMRLPIQEDPNKYIYDYRDGQIFVIDTIKEEVKEEIKEE
jgi:hypothetical protein